MALRTILATILCLAVAPAWGETPLRRLDTGNDSRGWEAVGRLNLGGQGFCTGALIAPDLVLTAAHCLWDKRARVRVDIGEIEFLAGWRNGRAAAYRGIRRAVVHPDYRFDGGEGMDQVPNDLALLELDRPIRQHRITPYETGRQPRRGASVGVVSYGRNRAEAASLQETCEVLSHRPGVLVMSCDVDFGSSGAPVFSLEGDVPRVVSVVSAKAEFSGRKVALGMDIEGPLAELRASMHRAQTRGPLPQITTRGRTDSGARFVRPPQE